MMVVSSVYSKNSRFGKLFAIVLGLFVASLTPGCEGETNAVAPHEQDQTEGEHQVDAVNISETGNLGDTVATMDQREHGDTLDATMKTDTEDTGPDTVIIPPPCTTDDECEASLEAKTPCMAAVCIQGACKLAPVPDGTACDPGDVCVSDAKCVDGVCVGSPLDCDDQNPCTDDSCDTAGSGCLHEPNHVACDDGSACTVGDTCAAGVCSPGPVKPCDDLDACTSDSCDLATGLCTHVVDDDGKPCDDNDMCTTGDTCVAGICTGQPIVCDDKNPCTADSCTSASGCVNATISGPCDDGNPCTTADACSGGACAGAPLSCDDGNPCTTDTCKAGLCEHTAISAACDDGNVCTTGDKCSGGKCAGGATLDCNDLNGCTDDSCDSATGCKHVNNTAACSDGNACTSADACSAGTCLTGQAIDCDDGNLCTDDSCDKTKGCVYANNSAGCDGGTCVSGACCKPQCAGKQCGDDQCGGSCGTCGAGEACVASGQCMAPPAGMVLIPAGEFWMGCNEAFDDDCYDSEYPYHKVYLAAYFIDVYEVTVAKYEQCVDAVACGEAGNWVNCAWGDLAKDQDPLDCVTWSQANAYCKWTGGRLPTEAEWERAARGLDGRKYPWGNKKPDDTYANYDSCETTPVGSYPKGMSPDGLYDMAGNVKEWVADWYSSDYYDMSPYANPQGPGSGSSRVTRGGGAACSWWNDLRTSARALENPNDPDGYLGLRCARSVP